VKSGAEHAVGQFQTRGAAGPDRLQPTGAGLGKERAVVVSADLVLIPTRPSPHDLRAVGSTVALVQGAGKPFVFAMTQAKPNTRLTVQAMAALSEHGKVAPAIVHDRVDYAGSMIDGRTVQEIDPRGRSAAEMAELWEFLKAQIANSTKARKRAVA
jgi:chromosome partitioning protein